MKPRKPQPFALEDDDGDRWEIVATCGTDHETNERRIVFEAVWDLRSAKECAAFRRWLDKAIAWRDAGGNQ